MINNSEFGLRKFLRSVLFVFSGLLLSAWAAADVLMKQANFVALPGWSLIYGELKMMLKTDL
jgi:hypothetical protein